MLTPNQSTRVGPICWMTALFLFAAIFASTARGQVVPSAMGPRHTLWVGGEYANTRATFPYGSRQDLWGIGGFADYSLARYLGIEADGRYLSTNGFYSEKQEDYLVGPQGIVGRSERLQPFAQLLVGLGRLTYPLQTDSGIYFVLAPGAGANLRVRDRWIVRGYYEYQLWPGSSHIANQPVHYLTPHGVHVGVAFRF